MPRTTARRIRSKLLALTEDPFARNPNVKRLSGAGRLATADRDWRVLYTLDTTDQIISIMVIRPRGSAYD